MSVPGWKTKLAFGDQSTYEASTVWTDFADITEFTGNEMEADDIETSNMETVNQVKTFMAGWADPGQLEMTCQFSKEQATTFYGLFRQNKGYRVLFNYAPSPSGSKLFCDGYIKAISNETDREGLITAKVVIKVSGDVDFVEAGA